MPRVYVIILSAFVAGLYYSCVSCELFSSVAKLQTAVRRIKLEDPLSKYLKKFTKQLNKQEKHLQELTTYVDKLEELSAGIRERDFDPKHPLNAFRFIRNHSVVYNETMEELLKVIDKVEGVTFSKTVLEEVEKMYPSTEDYFGIMNSINRIVETYEIDPYLVAVGELAGIQANPLYAVECQDLAHVSMRDKDLYMARQWLQLAIWLVETGNDTTVALEELYHDLSITAFIAGDMEVAIEYCIARIRMLPKHKTRHARKLLRHFRFELRENVGEGEGWELKKKSKLVQRYHSLCKGQVEEHEGAERKAAKSKLKCRYKKTKNPFYRYHRMKLEERSRDPYIVLYHDVLRPIELINLQKIGLPKLKRATVVDDRDGTDRSSKTRVSHSMFIKTMTRPVRRIMQRIEALTSLKFSSLSYESLQLSNYGLGGMYDEHFDFFPESFLSKQGKVGRSQRIATFMIYVTDVEAGGATVFTKIPEAIFPKAGNAVFWYNTFRNGREDRRMSHAGCPVIVGNKWLANEWIRSYGQEFNRPCALEEKF